MSNNANPGFWCGDDKSYDSLATCAEDCQGVVQPGIPQTDCGPTGTPYGGYQTDGTIFKTKPVTCEGSTKSGGEDNKSYSGAPGDDIQTCRTECEDATKCTATPDNGWSNLSQKECSDQNKIFQDEKCFNQTWTNVWSGGKCLMVQQASCIKGLQIEPNQTMLPLLNADLTPIIDVDSGTCGNYGLTWDNLNNVCLNLPEHYKGDSWHNVPWKEGQVVPTCSAGKYGKLTGGTGYCAEQTAYLPNISQNP